MAGSGKASKAKTPDFGSSHNQKMKTVDNLVILPGYFRIKAAN